MICNYQVGGGHSRITGPVALSKPPALHHASPNFSSNCYDGSIPLSEPDPEIRYTPFGLPGVGFTSVCGNPLGLVTPILVAPHSSLVFEGRFPGTITTGLKGAVVLERVAELQ